MSIGDRLHHYDRSQPDDWALLSWRARCVRFVAGWFFPPPPLTDAEWDRFLKRMGLFAWADPNRNCPT